MRKQSNSFNIKPSVPIEIDLENIIFPCFVQPEINGIRGFNFNGRLLNTAMNPFNNYTVNDYYSNPIFAGLDGMLTVSSDFDKRLYNKTLSVLKKVTAIDRVEWRVFDYIDLTTIDLPYEKRYNVLQHKVNMLNNPLISTCPNYYAKDIIQFMNIEKFIHDQGYDSIVIRNPYALYKEGKSSKVNSEFLRLRRSLLSDGIVLSINNSDSYYGYNNMINSINVRDLRTGEIVTVNAISLSHQERIHYFQHPYMLINRMITYSYKMKGLNKKPQTAILREIKNDSNNQVNFNQAIITSNFSLTR